MLPFCVSFVLGQAKRASTDAGFVGGGAERTGQTPMPLLGLTARQTTGVWATLAEFKVGFPPAAPGTAKESSKSKSRVSSDRSGCRIGS